MHYKITNLFFFVFFSGILFTSCQKELEGLGNTGGGGPVIPVNQKPKLGTTWTYRYYTYNQNGSLATSAVIIHKAKTKITQGGEKWLNIVDMGADTTVYLLNENSGGLYQFTNNSSNLLCKFPALINDTYNTFNEGSAESFTVKGVNDTLPTGIGNIAANYYEGVKGAQLIDQIWYNEYAWIVRKSQYRNRSVLIPAFYKYYTFFLDAITY